MNKSELLDALHRSRAQLQAALDGLGEAHLLEPVAGEWTVKDILSHLTAWEAELVTQLAKLRQGQTPRGALQSDAQVEATNAKLYAENKDRSLERVLADFQGVRKQTLRQIEAYSDSDLGASRKWLKGGTLLAWIVDETVDHELEHAQQIQAWRKRASD